MKKLFFCFFLTNLVCAHLNSQITKGLAFESSLLSGSVFKHSAKIKIEPQRPVIGAEVSAVWRGYGKQSWNQAHHYCSFGIAANYMNFGEDKVLGSAYGIMPHLTFHIVDLPKFQFNFRFSSGLGYITKYYNPITNPTNNIIGSHVNDMTALRFGAVWQLTRQWRLLTSFSFTHYSNGATQYPNLGINAVTGTLGVQYTANPVIKEDLIRIERPKRDKRLHLAASFFYGRNERGVAGGPKYPIMATTLEAYIHTGMTNRIGIGLGGEYVPSVTAFARQSGFSQNDADNRRQAYRYFATLGDEVLFGRIGLLGQAGFYLNKPILRPYFMNFKLGVRYYFLKTAKFPVQLHIGAYLKSHFGTAEYASLGLGMFF